MKAGKRTRTGERAGRVLVLSPEDPARPRGGLGFVVSQLCREFVALGAEVTLVKKPQARSRAPGQAAFLDPYVASEASGRELGLASFAKDALLSAETARPDALHAHDWLALETGRRVRERFGLRLVAHVHSTEWDRTLGHVDPWILEHERRGLLSADRVICVSERTREAVVSRLGVPRERTCVVYPAAPVLRSTENADVRHLEPTLGPRSERNSPLVLFLGRLVPQKGLDVFLRVARRIRHCCPEARFLIAGSGPSFGAALEQALHLGLGSVLRFSGWLKREEVEELLRRTSVLLLPSVAEPFGLVALEAARAGVPVVASRVCGFREALPAYAEFEALDIDAAASGVLSALRESARVESWQERAQAALSRLTPTACAARALGEILPATRSAGSADQELSAAASK